MRLNTSEKIRGTKRRALLEGFAWGRARFSGLSRGLWRPLGGVVLSCVPCGAAAPDWLPPGLPPPPENGPTLCPGDYLTPAQAEAVQEAVLTRFPDGASWTAHAEQLRRRIRGGAELWPWPARTALNPIIHSRRAYEGYTVENVAFETVPGYWATGNLYRPTDAEPPHAAVLHTHGHSAGPDGPGGWGAHGRFKADVQLRAAALARMGAVSFTIDMFGYGDQVAQLGHGAHRSAAALRVQTWNAVRALDFLVGLKDVDASRLGVTGHSGGGTQAFLLSALDERVAVSVPVAMVSGWFFGGCPCESGMPIHRSESHFANNAMIAALTAPRPLLVVSDGADWTKHTPEIEYPFLEKIYRSYGAGGNVANVHLAEEGHDYGPSKRAAMYPFMARHLGLDFGLLLNAEGTIDERALVVEEPALMRVFDADHPLPAGALPDAEAIAESLSRLQK